jgi:hypothetical protein
MLEIFVETYIESCYCELLVSQNMNPSLAGLNDALDLVDMDKQGLLPVVVTLGFFTIPLIL